MNASIKRLLGALLLIGTLGVSAFTAAYCGAKETSAAIIKPVAVLASMVELDING